MRVIVTVGEVLVIACVHTLGRLFGDFVRGRSTTTTLDIIVLLVSCCLGGSGDGFVVVAIFELHAIAARALLGKLQVRRQVRLMLLLIRRVLESI